MNLVEASLEKGQVSFAGFSLPIPPDRDLTGYEGRTVIVGIRPSDFEDAAVWNRAGLPTIRVVPDVTEELGTEIHVIFTVDAPPVLTEGARAAIAGDDEEVLAPLDDRATFTARVDPRSDARAGRPVLLTVDPQRLHFFDPESGLAVGSRRPAHAPA